MRVFVYLLNVLISPLVSYAALASGPQCVALFDETQIDRNTQDIQRLRDKVEAAVEALPREIQEKVFANRGEDPSKKTKFEVRTSSNHPSFLPDPLIASSRQPIVTVTINHRKWTMVHGDLFVSDYHAFNRFYYLRKADRPSMRQLASSHPWMKWDRATQAYSLQFGGTAERMMSHLFEESRDATVTLYRGTRPAEMEFMQRVTAGDPAALAELHKRMSDEQLYSGYFFTPSLANAQTWSKGQIVEIRLSRDLAQKLLASSSLYAGVEEDMIEVAVIDPNAMLAIAPLYTSR